MFTELKPGSVIIIIPTKPIMTANHLNMPTFSLNKKIENIVVNIGAAKEIPTTFANWKIPKAINNSTKAINPKAHLKKCNPALLV